LYRPFFEKWKERHGTPGTPGAQPKPPMAARDLQSPATLSPQAGRLTSLGAVEAYLAAGGGVLGLCFRNANAANDFFYLVPIVGGGLTLDPVAVIGREEAWFRDNSSPIANMIFKEQSAWAPPRGSIRYSGGVDRSDVSRSAIGDYSTGAATPYNAGVWPKKRSSTSVLES